MSSQYKNIGISMGMYLLIVLFFFFTAKSGYELIPLQDYLWETILFSLLRFMIGIIRNTQDKNTKILKKILIIIQVYLVLRVFFQKEMIFNTAEFTLIYFLILSIYYYQKKKIITIISWILILFIIANSVLVIYREPVNLKNFYQQQENKLIISSPQEYPIQKTYITLNEGEKKHTIKNQTIVLKENKNYQIAFFSSIFLEKSRGILEDKKGNILIIYPKSKVNSSFWEEIIYSTILWKTHYLAKEEKNEEGDENLIKIIQQIRAEREEKLQHFIINKLPSYTRKNKRIQQITQQYTSFLKTILPFIYQKNYYYMQDYLPYLN